MIYISEQIRELQANILIIEGVLCIFLALFSNLIKSLIKIKKISIIGIEISAAIIVFAEVIPYYFEGKTTPLALALVNGCNFTGFLFINIILIFFAHYIRANLMECGKDIGKKRLLITCIVASVGALMVVVAQFPHLYYYIDSGNYYHRAKFFPISVIFPCACMGFLITVIIDGCKYLRKDITTSFFIFCTLPIAAFWLQFIVFGLSTITISIGLGSIVVFSLALRDQNQVIVEAASRDMLTGLPNSYGYVNRIQQLKERENITKYNSIYFDIQRFGAINRKYGPETGDVIIKKYAEYLKTLIGPEEIAARLSGDCFVAMVLKENTQTFLHLIRETDFVIPMESMSDPQNIKLFTIVGVYPITDESMDPNTLIGYASAALHLAKQNGKKPYLTLTQDMQKHVNDARMFELQLPEAIEKNEFLPYYQPKVNANTKALCGAEALVRWKTTNQLVLPGKFIPVLELSDEICKLDFYMLNHVCQDIVTWLEKGLVPPVISVNFSRKNLGNPNFADDVYNVIQKYGLSPSYIQVEVTETTDEYTLAELKNVVDSLHRLGISVAIDDFGTGSASLSLLRDIEFDVIKIDKSFIENSSLRDQKVLEHIMALAKAIGISILVEGVEYGPQLNFLRGLGCNEIQGFLFDKPLPKEKFEERLVSRQY